jgi:hypothetical protein
LSLTGACYILFKSATYKLIYIYIFIYLDLHNGTYCLKNVINITHWQLLICKLSIQISSTVYVMYSMTSTLVTDLILHPISQHVTDSWQFCTNCIKIPSTIAIVYVCRILSPPVDIMYFRFWNAIAVAIMKLMYLNATDIRWHLVCVFKLHRLLILYNINYKNVIINMYTVIPSMS